MSKHLTGNQINAERLSALMDGELSSEELDELLKAVDDDPQLKQLWRRMNQSQNAMKRSSQMGLDVDISAAVMSAVKKEAQANANENNTSVVSFPAAATETFESRDPAGSRNKADDIPANQPNAFMHMAVAASVAMFTLLIWNIWGDAQLSQSDRSGLVADGGAVQVEDSHPQVAPKVTEPVALVSSKANKQNVLANHVSFKPEEYRVQSRSTQADHVRWEQLEPYVMAHSVRSVQPAGTGMISFGRVVDPENMPKPVFKVVKAPSSAP